MTDPAELRQQFEDELRTLTNRLQAIERDIQKPKAADWEEQATDSENDEVLDALDVATREKIESLQTALVKLDDGTYGLCESCEEEISPERLEAIPWAAVCLSCAD